MKYAAVFEIVLNIHEFYISVILLLLSYKSYFAIIFQLSLIWQDMRTSVEKFLPESSSNQNSSRAVSPPF